ncbi:uncharacterized protein LOC141698283 [Apium graveolens]|uniref:uncharacterized protein LOC141698283 n=1 Tax=Apium graveolens TaxID=4045 RepID=UPI003D790D54
MNDNSESMVVTCSIGGQSVEFNEQDVNAALGFLTVNLVDVPTQDELAEFMDFINYGGRINLASLNRTNLRKEWSFVFDSIVRAFTCRKTGYDNISSVVQKLVFSIAYNGHLNVGLLILEEHATRIIMPLTTRDSSDDRLFHPCISYHSEPSVGGPSSDPLSVALPVLAILPPPMLQPVLLQAIPPLGVRPPIRGPPPADSDSTGHSVASVPFQSTLHPVPYYRYEALLLERDSLLAHIRELQHIIKTTDVNRGMRELREEIHVTCRILEARLHGATSPGRGPDAFMGWASEVMEDLERLGGPEFPRS